MKKPFYKSKMFWANALTLGLHFGKPFISGATGVDVSTVPDVSPEVLALVNIALRLVTAGGLSVK